MISSMMLNDAEDMYSQIVKEVLANVFRIKTFYQYTFGSGFYLYTDHDPLTAIFGPKHGIPVMGPSKVANICFVCSATNLTSEKNKY